MWQREYVVSPHYGKGKMKDAVGMEMEGHSPLVRDSSLDDVRSTTGGIGFR